MFETYRILGEQREQELLREAKRLHAGKAAPPATRRATNRHPRTLVVLSVTALRKLIPFP